MRSVGELTIWKTNLKAVSTYFRTSKNRKKELLKFFPTAREFPRYHDVRFAQHFLNLVDALLFNIDACKQVWQQLVETGDRNCLLYTSPSPRDS